MPFSNVRAAAGFTAIGPHIRPIGFAAAPVRFSIPARHITVISTDCLGLNIKYVNINIKELINRLQQEKGKNIWICGGANLVNQCIKENLIDEYQITTVPVILGNGIRLFEENNKKIRLELKEIKEENGLIMGIYAKR